MIPTPSIGISPAWEEESPGPNPKSLEKNSKMSSDPHPPQKEKLQGESEKSRKSPFSDSFEAFPTLLEFFLLGA